MQVGICMEQLRTHTLVSLRNRVLAFRAHNLYLRYNRALEVSLERVVFI